MRGRAAIAGLAMALAGLVLTGCEASGVVDLSTGSSMTVDLTVDGTDASTCAGYGDVFPGMVMEFNVQGRDECRVRGTAGTQDLLNRAGVFAFSTTGDKHLLLANLTPFQTYDSGLTVDVDVVMPGSIVRTSSGTVSGNRVHVTDVTGGLLVVESSTAPNPVPWEIAGGVAALVLAFGLGWWLRGWRQRRLRPDPGGDVDVAVVTAGVPAAPTAEGTQPGSPPAGADTIAAGREGPAFLAPDAPGIPFHWGPPSGEPVPGSPPPPAPEPSPDRSMWAPPPDWRH